jgi:osmotically-inducible protein OsmY
MKKKQSETISGSVKGVDTSFRNTHIEGKGEIENRSYLSPYGKRMRENVCEALYHSALIDASDVDIIIEGKTLYLKGTVDSEEMKGEAERCVENLPGIDDIRNELSIRKSS